ncbi:Clp protease N-terminal domain-containing protein [Rhodococcus sp. T2V]|uniref:Clp protease N-terminal domain-containing protein n=1 Tax=Rhodococcus sp. T2V TaxID=3034164 RepID=UPI0023E286E4|nr:Clp protease N-terminal domain-containing protein [Rhodococcus sp. T2V]MDF3313503.1 Clp protease N-terminal domain-containing protein [Rhodococcus sp. T2V]
MVFERFSDQARQVVVLAGAARTHHQNWRRHRTPARRDLRRRRPRNGSTDLMGHHRPGTREQARGRSAHRRDPPRPPDTSQSPAKTKKVLEGSLRQTALLGHEEIGTDHLLLALLDDPAFTGAQILTDLVTLSISEMREHAHRPTPGPTHPHPVQRRRTHPHPRRRSHRRPEPSKPPVHDRITDTLDTEQPE